MPRSIKAYTYLANHFGCKASEKQRIVVLGKGLLSITLSSLLALLVTAALLEHLVRQPRYCCKCLCTLLALRNLNEGSKVVKGIPFRLVLSTGLNAVRQLGPDRASMKQVSAFDGDFEVRHLSLTIIENR
jgi:hypothetical protein